MKSFLPLLFCLPLFCACKKESKAPVIGSLSEARLELTVYADKKPVYWYSAQEPYIYISYDEGLLPAVKEKLQGKKAGEVFSFTVPARQAYGECKEEFVKDLLIDDIKRAEEGLIIYGEDAGGNKRAGIITKVTKTGAKVDFNHPLCSKELTYSGKILEVKDVK